MSIFKKNTSDRRASCLHCFHLIWYLYLENVRKKNVILIDKWKHLHWEMEYFKCKSNQGPGDSGQEPVCWVTTVQRLFPEATFLCMNPLTQPTGSTFVAEDQVHIRDGRQTASRYPLRSHRASGGEEDWLHHLPALRQGGGHGIKCLWELIL